MQLHDLAALLLCASTASAYPTNTLTARDTDIDTTVLQFALTLEHLENAFYKQALSMFSEQDFYHAGFGADYYNNIQLIGSDEDQHVSFLTSALTAAGATPVAPCTYNFPMTDVLSFIGLSMVLEGVGTSAYLGGAPLITSKDYLTAAGSILVTEALHTSLQRTALKAAPAANAYGTPLDPNAVYTLAASFITGCPSGNTGVLPFKTFPALTSNQHAGTCEGPECHSAFFQKRDATEDDSRTAPKPASVGDNASFAANSTVPAGSFLTFVSGLTVVSVPAQGSGSTVTAAIPQGVTGQAYVMVTSADSKGKFDASAVLFGPAILEGKRSMTILIH